MTTNTDIKNYTERANNLLDEIEALGEDYKELIKEMESNGVDTVSFKSALKIKRKGRNKSKEAKVNEYLSQMGEQMYFAGL